MDFWVFLVAVVVIIIDVAFALYAGNIAEQKGYSRGNWIAICLIFGVIGYILIAALPDLELRATLENIEKKLAKDKNDNYLPRSSSNRNSDSNRNSNSSNSNCTVKSLSEMKPLAPLSDSMDYWTCKYCGLENTKEARRCKRCGEYR